MNTLEVTFARVYLTEADGRLQSLLQRLHDWEKVRGVTVLRGISGFGRSGEVHSSSLLDMSLNLPLVVEFFDEPAKVQMILEHIGTDIDPGHIVFWNAMLVI